MKTGKGRITNSVVRTNEQETENVSVGKIVPGTFTELVNKCRKPSRPERAKVFRHERDLAAMLMSTMMRRRMTTYLMMQE